MLKIGDLICSCGHGESRHYWSKLKERRYCNVKRDNSYVDDCNDFKPDNLKYLEKLAEEKIGC